MTSQASYSTILRSSAIIGGAQFTNILIGLVRIKMVALLLGPAGIGLLGFYTNLIQIAATVSGLGINTTGTRQIAAANAKGGTDAISLSRRALFWGSLALALTGGAIFWLASGWIARVVLADAGRSSEVAWLALGVTLTVAASSQSALLTGLRRVGDLARVNVGAGIISTVLSVLALWALGDKALVLVALLGPGVGFVLGHVYVARLAKPSGPATSLTTMAPEWREMVALGLPFMLSGLVMTLGQLLVRTILQRELGLGAAGYFQAAWAIGMMYLGFILGAMGTDYYPRLAALIRDAREATSLVNEQTEVALLLLAPVLLALLGLSPWVIALLYSAEFGPAVEVLRWQLLGDVFKVLSWPLAMVLTAAGAGKTFFLMESAAMLTFVVMTFLGIPYLGVAATGVGFLAMYGVHLPLVWIAARRLIDFRWRRSVRWQAIAVILATVTVDVVSRADDFVGAVVGLVLAFAFGLWALLRLAERSGAKGRLGRLAALGQKLNGWLARKT